jgi:outer membrane protein assembly factor BamE
MAKFFTVGKKMRIIIILMATLMTITLTQCVSYDFSRRIVQQGNLIPSSKIERLKLGMTKEEVAILMGNSLISPLFTNDRWDYAYTWRKGNGTREIRNAVLYFSHDRVVKIEHTP